MYVLAAVLDGVALRSEHILKYSVSTNYVYDFSHVLLGVCLMYRQEMLTM
jgi:hypothetical protein